jgi:hypothetical protein
MRVDMFVGGAGCNLVNRADGNESVKFRQRMSRGGEANSSTICLAPKAVTLLSDFAFAEFA